MNIALCGAGGTGKGTLAENLVTVYDNLFGSYIPVIKSPAQDIAKTLYPESENFSDIVKDKRLMFQYCGLFSQISMEKNLFYNDMDYICERSIFDYLAYFNIGLDDKLEYKKYKSIVKRHYEEYPYDYLCFLGLDFIPADKKKNKWKERDQQSREERDKILREIIFDNNMAYKSTVIDLTGIEDKARHIMCRIM